MLIETSAVRVALGYSTPPHCKEFAAQTEGGQLVSSTYVRMEFHKRWIRTYIDLAMQIAHFENLHDAIEHLSHSFSPRYVKSILHSLGGYLREKGVLKDAKTASIEMLRVAKAEQYRFDSVLKSKTSNSCGCRIGNRVLTIDFNDPVKSCSDYLDATKNVTDCDVNSFFRKKHEVHKSALSSCVSKSVISLNARAQKLVNGKKHIDCKDCCKVGDLIIGFEQPRKVSMVHVDNSFDEICGVTGVTSIPIPSESKSVNDANQVS